MILFLVSLFFISYQSFYALKFNEISSQFRSLIKILINHNYYLTFINTFSLELAEKIRSIMDFNNKYATVVPEEIASIDCFISGYASPEKIEFLKILMFSIFPFLICCLVILIRIFGKLIYMCRVYCFKKSQQEIKIVDEKIESFRVVIFSSVIVTFYSYYSRLILNAFILLKCITLDESQRTFLEIDPNVECWSAFIFNLFYFYSKSLILVYRVAFDSIFYLDGKKL